MASKLADFINVSGVVDEQDARLEFIMPVDAISQWPVTDAIQTEPAVLVEFQNIDGTIVSRYPIGAQVPCLHPLPGEVRPVELRIVSGIVRLPPDASLMRIVDSSSVLIERKIPQNGPVVDFNWDFAQGEFKQIQWKAFHPDGEPMTHTLCEVMKDGTWRPLTLPSPATEATIDINQLSGGELALGVFSTDGFHVTRVASKVFELPLKPCVPNIISPAEGERFRSGEPIFLSGWGSYPENTERELRWLFWFDDVQGPLGPCRDFEVKLKPGKHQITLRAGVPGREGEASVSVFVE